MKQRLELEVPATGRNDGEKQDPGRRGQALRREEVPRAPTECPLDEGVVSLHEAVVKMLRRL